MSQAKKVLERARELITDPAHHTQDAYAKDDRGIKVSVNNVRATCWCSMGAISKAETQLGYGFTDGARNLLVTAMEGNIIKFNDSHTHEEVLAAFDNAIQEASQ